MYLKLKDDKEKLLERNREWNAIHKKPTERCIMLKVETILKCYRERRLHVDNQ